MSSFRVRLGLERLDFIFLFLICESKARRVDRLTMRAFERKSGKNALIMMITEPKFVCICSSMSILLGRLSDFYGQDKRNKF